VSLAKAFDTCQIVAILDAPMTTLEATSHKHTGMARLVREEPEKAKTTLRAALKKRLADVKLAAVDLGVSWRSLYRWLERLGMLGEVETMRQKIGVCPHCKLPLNRHSR